MKNLLNNHAFIAAMFGLMLLLYLLPGPSRPFAHLVRATRPAGHSFTEQPHRIIEREWPIIQQAGADSIFPIVIHHSKRIGIVYAFLDQRMRERAAYVSREQFATRGAKGVRAQSIRGRMALDGLHVPAGARWLADFRAELLRFPAGRHYSGRRHRPCGATARQDGAASKTEIAATAATRSLGGS